MLTESIIADLLILLCFIEIRDLLVKKIHYLSSFFSLRCLDGMPNMDVFLSTRRRKIATTLCGPLKPFLVNVWRLRQLLSVEESFRIS